MLSEKNQRELTGSEQQVLPTPLPKNSKKNFWIGAFLFVCLVGIYFYWAARPDPRFTLANLQGLTPDQVIARLGPPEFDSRLGNGIL
jgi:hypothetical protein